MSFKPRKLIEELPAVSHGGLIQAELTELGLKPEDIIDFSVSTNPFMPPPGIRDVISSSPIERYPDSTSAALTLKLAERHGLPAEAIVVASGTTELIRAVALACLRPRDKVIIIEPTYGEYEPAVRLSGGKILHLRAQEAAGFVPDIAAVINMISTYRPRALFLCNPNNPTGILLPEYDIERITASLGDTLLVLDEAYMTFIEAGWSSLDLSNRANVVIMRSMTKDYGLPGLRLGYAVTGSAIARYLRKVLPPWNVNAAAQAAGLAVLDMDDYLAETVRRTMEAKEYLVAELRKMNYSVVPSSTNYFIVKVGHAALFRRRLLKHRIMVRDCTSFGLPEYVRIAARPLEECRRLIEAIRLMHEAPSG